MTISKNNHKYSSPRQVRAAALIYLSRRHHSRKELKEKLVKKGAKEEDIDRVLAGLVGDGILNEEKMVEAFIHQRKEIALKGPGYIYRELVLKGIDQALIEEGLVHYYDEEEQLRIVSALIEKELKKLPATREKQRRFFDKITRMIQRRGFDFALSKNIIEAKKILILDKRQD